MGGPVARIDLSALRHNLARAREAAPQSRIMAVIKADAYGHGMLQAARALAEADAFAVARVEEGIALRKAGVAGRVVVLSGPGSPVELPLAIAAELEPVLHHEHQIAMVESGLRGTARGLRCWVKVDSGMHRLGFPPDATAGVLARLRAVQGAVPAGLMTHLANADDLADSKTLEQVQAFGAAAAFAGLPTSMANSAGVLGWPATHGDWVRPGIMLYGASPFIDGDARGDGLQVVMTLRTRLIAVNRLRKGDAIGYGGTWRCPEDMPVGVAAVGYGDGYPRHAPSGTPILVKGRRAVLVGRVSMDTCVVDLRTVPGARVGDTVELWGEGLPVDEVAAAAGTISYELFCRLTPRVKFRYEGAGMVRVS